MEEQRIGVMYWNLFKRRLWRIWDAMFPRGLRRSSALPALIVVALIGLPGLGYYLHMRGKFASVKREIKGEQQGPEVNMLTRPGGLEPVLLTRSQTPGSSMAEFRSMTLLPGLGMGVLQITANLPDRGEVALLSAPSPEEISTVPRRGETDTRGAIELPWAGVLTGLLSPVGTSLRANWHGRPIEAPTTIQGRPLAYGGMLSMIAADSVDTGGQPEGPNSTATFKGTDFNEHWVSRTAVTVVATLGARAVELTVTAKNVGDLPEPMGMGWHPRILIPSGQRNGVELRLPGGDEMEEGDPARGVPSGRIVPARPGLARFQGHPAPLGDGAVEVTVVHPKPALLDTGVETDLRDVVSGIGLRMTAISSDIHVVQAASPAGANYVVLGTQTNYDDPLGKEWQGAEGAAITTLMPGQSMTWKVRLEIYEITRK